ncbi:MAG: restriction endonuclease subunit S [Anaerolineales bacterium]|nr:restriction endonuclease subunit S [Anaerolineales bacterium]
MTDRVLLEDIVTKIGNGIDAEQVDQQSNGMLPISRIETIWNGAIDFDRVKFAHVSQKEIEKYALKSGDILFSHINSPEHIGKTGLYRSEQTLIHGINLLLIRVDQEKCHPEYLDYYFKSKNVRALFRARCKKAVNQASLNQPDVLSLEIPLPPLTEQKRIASLLRRADRLRALRRTAHELGESLLQSVFLEMFGNVVKNEKGFDVYPFEELSTRITKGESPNWQGFSYEESGVLFITSENVLWGTLDISSPKYISEKFHNKLKRSQLAKNDLLINLVGASIGRAALVTDDALPANINQAVATVSIDTTKLNTYFALYQILNPYKQNQLLGNIVESARANISLTNISELNLIVPPLNLQEEFAGVVARVESLRGRMSESTRQVEGLFESLLAEAFNG